MGPSRTTPEHAGLSFPQFLRQSSLCCGRAISVPYSTHVQNGTLTAPTLASAPFKTRGRQADAESLTSKLHYTLDLITVGFGLKASSSTSEVERVDALSGCPSLSRSSSAWLGPASQQHHIGTWVFPLGRAGGQSGRGSVPADGSGCGADKTVGSSPCRQF